jgi:hypothetical protein
LIKKITAKIGGDKCYILPVVSENLTLLINSLKRPIPNDNLPNRILMLVVHDFILSTYHLAAPLANANPHTSLAPAFFSIRAHSVMV